MSINLYLDFDKIETIEDIRLVFLLLSSSVSPTNDIIIKQKAIDDFPQVMKLCNTKKYSERNK